MNKNINFKAVLIQFLTMTVLITLATTLSVFGNFIGIGKESIIMLYLLCVLFTTVFTKNYIYGFITAVLGVMLFNFLFTEPKYTFVISSSNDLVLLVFFLVTAIVAGTIMLRLQKQMEIANKNEKTAKLLYEVSGGFLHLTGRINIIMRGISYIYEHCGCAAYVLLYENNETYKSDKFEIPESENFCEYIINGTSLPIGAFYIYGLTTQQKINHEMLFKTVATQTGIALSREFMYEERENIKIEMEKEKMRSTLLRSVAHDLRSPLTALTGASSILYDSFEKLSNYEKKSLARDINEEMIWLANLVENILNMTRINESRLVIKKDYEVVDDVVEEASKHMKKLLEMRNFKIKLPNEVVSLPMDGKLVSQVLINLLDNAYKYTKVNDSILISVRTEKNKVVFCVEDSGNGIDKNIEKKLFDSFIRDEKGSTDGKRGIGLGLAICKAIVDGHGGEIHFEENQPKGAKFIFWLPLE